ncbi:hypothetical protein D3C72_951870 [compost metagenome]
MRVEVLADGHGDLVAQDDVLLQAARAQVQVAVLQAQVLVHALVADRERGGLGGVEDLRLAGEHLDGAAREVGVLLPGGASVDHAADADDELVAGRIGDGVGLRVGLRVEDDLHEARAIAQIDEDDPAVVATALDPAVEGHGLTDVGLGDLAVVGTARTEGRGGGRHRWHGRGKAFRSRDVHITEGSLYRKGERA